MPEYTQDKREIALETPLGKDVLLLTSFSGREAMSRLFSFQLETLSEKDSLQAKDIVGKNVSFRVDFPDGSHRWFNGFVNRFTYCGRGDRLNIYRAEVVPWLWFLTRTSDLRIFQEKTVPDIIKQVFGDLGFSDFELELKGSHPKWDYCVQYRETDFNFVSRLMEQEGIFYYFRHEQGKHTLVLADQKGAYKDCTDKEVQLLANLSGPESTDQLFSWEHQYEFRSGKWAHTDYNFETPSTSLMAQTKSVVQLDGNSKLEFYDFPGEYAQKGDGDAAVKIRMEEEETAHNVVQGTSHCRSFSPGGKFKVTKHHASGEAGGQYVLTAVNHSASVGSAYQVGGEHAEVIYSNSFACIPDSVVFRPARITPKPTVQGVQTALVVGPSGEEIYTDKYGRVKVQFYWDREGKKDEKSSCWIRVAQPWSGKNWGAIHIPRIGQEVVVSHVEGDPDRPLITGMVYNAETMPPYSLPDNKTQTGIKTRSSKDASEENFNELRFEDKKGEEEIYFHAEKNFNRVVENNDTLKVGFEKKDDGDQTIEIHNNQKLTVGNAQSKDGSQTVDIWKDRTTTLKTGNDSLAIKQGNRDVVIDMGNDSLKIKMGNQTTKLDLGKSDTEAMQSIELKVGQSSIKLDQMGVTIKGMMIKVEGQMMTEVKGLMTKTEGSAMLTLKGGLTMIN